MAKYNPIGLYGEGTAAQTHDGYKDGDTIAARHQDIVGYISAKAGNAIRLGSDKLLYVNNLCRGTSAKTPTAASDPFAAGYPTVLTAVPEGTGSRRGAATGRQLRPLSVLQRDETTAACGLTSCAGALVQQRLRWRAWPPARTGAGQGD